MGLVCANGRMRDRGVRVSSVGLVAGHVAVCVAVGGSGRASLRRVRGVYVCAHSVCDCRRVCVVQRAAAPAVCGGERGGRQSLLDKSGDVLDCLCDQRALSVPFLFFVTLPFPISAHLSFSFLNHF